MSAFCLTRVPPDATAVLAEADVRVGRLVRSSYAPMIFIYENTFDKPVVSSIADYYGMRSTLAKFDRLRGRMAARAAATPYAGVVCGIISGSYEV